MLESSGVLDAMMAPVEQVLQRAAAADVNLDALELCDLQQSSRRASLCVFVSLYLSLCHTHTHTRARDRCPAFAPLSCALRAGTAGPRVCR